MRRIFAILGMVFSMQGFAQFADAPLEGVPTVPITRKLCVQMDDDAHTRSIQRTASTQADAPLSAFGSPKIVVCLAQFPDTPYSVAEDNDGVKKIFHTFFNGDAIGAGDNTHSVSDYFKDMSGGKFTPEFVITDPVTLSKERSYYGNAQGGNRRTVFRNEALDSLSRQIKDRVGELDTDGDGMIDGVVIVFTGCGANVGDEDGMHPACWTGTVSRAGISYATALVAPELLGKDNSLQGGQNEAKLNGIGVFVHEISHMLGLPDFYDLNYKAPGMDYWSLMDYGEYWSNGYHPTPYTAYERHFMGWTTLVELSEPTHVPAMKSLAEGGSAYIIYNDGNRDEYYILENRNANDPWSRSLCTSLGNGMMIYHVDFDASKWSANKVNTDINRQRMTIIPANGHFEICDNLMEDMPKYVSELRGHLWPLSSNESVLAYFGLKGNNSLTDVERTEGDRIAPAAVLHTPNTDGEYLMHKPITDIAYNNASMTVSFSFMGGGETGIHDEMEHVSSSADAPVSVYSMDGRMVARCRRSYLSTLPGGIYVVRDMLTGKTAKTIVSK